MNVTIIGSGNMGRGDRNPCSRQRAVHSVTFVDANPEVAEKAPRPT